MEVSLAVYFESHDNPIRGFVHSMWHEADRPLLEDDVDEQFQDIFLDLEYSPIPIATQVVGQSALLGYWDAVSNWDVLEEVVLPLLQLNPSKLLIVMAGDEGLDWYTAAPDFSKLIHYKPKAKTPNDDLFEALLFQVQ